MAMIVDSLASQFADTLTSLIKDEITMMMSVKDDLQKLERKVRMIHSVLEDAERKAISDAAVKTWLTELRDALYDADDIIDHALTHAERVARLSANQPVRCCAFFSSAHHRLLFRHRIGGRIRSLNARLQEIFEENKNFGLALNASNKGGSIRIRRDSDPDVELDIVGSEINNDTNDLVQMMISSKFPTICVYGIVGMGGIGKTTLAQMINNHETIKLNFQLPPPIWVCVSQEYSPEEMLKSILKYAGGGSGNTNSVGELQNALSKAVKQKKIFLVLDDIWDVDLWIKYLRKPLLNASAGSVVLITSRDERVATAMNAVYLHSVQPLSVDDGWALVCNLVFRSAGEETEMQLLENIGKQIVEKCHGHPLAIKTIAGVLHGKEKRPNDWERVLTNPAWSLTEFPEGVMGVLYLSYEDLPSHLKQCFIFCSLFPEDHVFMRHTLIQHWVALGFVKEHNNMIMEEVAREYYRELLRRNLLQKDPDYYGEGGSKMHDLLRSLAKFLSQDEYFSGDIAALTTASSSSPTMKLRHLSIIVGDTDTFPEIVKEQTSVRTLCILTMCELPEDLFRKLKCLRLIDLSSTIFFKAVPESISSLVHLRYLNLSYLTITMLPETIGDLSNLQYLILQHCELLSELPKSIAKMYKLRSIDALGTPLNGLPVGIGGLVHLNRLMGFVIAGENSKCYSSLEEIKPLIHLRAITIRNLEGAAKFQGSILKDKTYIYHLTLSCSSSSSPYPKEDAERIQEVFEERLFPPHTVQKFKIEGYFGFEFPTWMKNINLFLNLTKLEISKCKSCTQFPPLGQLPLLDSLKIKGALSLKQIGLEFMGNGRDCFPKLKSLTLKDMPEWEEWIWEARDGARVMPILESLEISKCPQLKSLPKGLIHHATSLTSLCIKEAHSLTVIEGFKSAKAVLLLGNDNLVRVSDFPSVHAMTIEDCPALLQDVEVLPSLEILEWGDSRMNHLPEWMLPQPIPKFPMLKKMLVIVSDVPTLRQCVIGGPDWPKIQQFPTVFISVNFGQEFIAYTKEPFSFVTNIDAVADPVDAAPAGDWSD